MERIRARNTREFSQLVDSDHRVDDMIMPTPKGDALVKHAQFLSAGLMPRENSDKEIALLTVLASEDGAFPNLGLIHLMSPEEARIMGNSLLRLADDKYREEAIGAAEAEDATKQ